MRVCRETAIVGPNRQITRKREEGRRVCSSLREVGASAQKWSGGAQRAEIV